MARHTPTVEVPSCDLCGAYVANEAQHRYWHEQVAPLPFGVRPDAGDDYPTAKLPPVRERILPRPPAPEVRELKGAELLRAIADELARDEDLDDGDGAGS